MNFIRKFTLSSLIAAVAVLTGCANIQPKVDAFEQQSKRLGVIYAQVNWVKSPEDWGYCDSSRAPSQAKQAICKSNMNAVQVSWVSKGMKTYPLLEAIPKNVSHLVSGAIVKIDMNKPYGQRFLSVVSIEERETCKWDGKKNAFSESTAYKTAITAPAFVAGAILPIPAVAYFVNTRDDLGGVVCDGWNYQEAYKDKDIDSLINIF